MKNNDYLDKYIMDRDENEIKGWYTHQPEPTINSSIMKRHKLEGQNRRPGNKNG